MFCSSVLSLTYTERKNQWKPISGHTCLCRIPNTCKLLAALRRKKTTFVSRWFQELIFSPPEVFIWFSGAFWVPWYPGKCPAVPVQGFTLPVPDHPLPPCLAVTSFLAASTQCLELWQYGKVKKDPETWACGQLSKCLGMHATYKLTKWLLTKDGCNCRGEIR